MAFGEMQWERFDKNRRCFGIVYGRFHDCLLKKRFRWTHEVEIAPSNIWENKKENSLINRANSFAQTLNITLRVSAENMY